MRHGRPIAFRLALFLAPTVRLYAPRCRSRNRTSPPALSRAVDSRKRSKRRRVFAAQLSGTILSYREGSRLCFDDWTLVDVNTIA